MQLKEILRGFYLAIFFMPGFIGCDLGPEFDDDSMSVLKRPEIIAVVLDPPEASPGEAVNASYLFADQNGVSEGQTQIWVLSDAEEGGYDGEAFDSERLQSLVSTSPSVDDSETPDSEYDYTMVGLSPTFTFTVPPTDRFTFDENGLSTLLISLYVSTREIDIENDSAETLAVELNDILVSADTQIGLRTLIVSENEQMSGNPGVAEITLRPEGDDEESSVVFFTSYDSDPEQKRQYAIDHPYVYPNCDEIRLIMRAEAAGESEETERSFRFQWISSDGNFINNRKQSSGWKPPDFVSGFSPDYVDETGDAVELNETVCQDRRPADFDPDLYITLGADASEDPNLYPVWVIIRDAASNRAGQSWAEFYVRIII